MKKYLFIFLFIVFFSCPVFAYDGDITLYFFHGDGCPHCAEESKYLETLSDQYPNLKIEKHEVWYNTKNSALLEKVKSALDTNATGVPFTIIGSKYIIGYSSGTSRTIERAIQKYQNDEEEYQDIVLQVKEGTYQKPSPNSSPTEEDPNREEENLSIETITIPFINKSIHLKDISLLGAAIVIGFVDGFNPCAMWVLLFLISMLIHMKDSKRRWILGLTFLITSALVYFLIMFSWLQIVVKVSTSIAIRYCIGVIAFVGGIINLRSYLHTKNDSGCEVVDDKKRKSILNRIKKFTKEKSFGLAILGIIGLAISVNLVELACSAGLPVVFTQILSINHTSGINSLFYMFIYILFFLIDDLIIFFIAMFTMKVTGISTKYNKYSHLIGGLLMLFIGILIIFKPEWLMFS